MYVHNDSDILKGICLAAGYVKSKEPGPTVISGRKEYISKNVSRNAGRTIVVYILLNTLQHSKKLKEDITYD